MATRFSQVNQFIKQVNPGILAEAGINEFSVTEKLIDEAFLNNKNVTYFYMGQPGKITEYSEKFDKLKSKYQNLITIPINLAENVDVSKEYDINGGKIKITDADFAFLNDIDEANDFLSCLTVFQNSKCIIINKVFQNPSEELANKSANPILPKIKHEILPVVDTVLEGDEFVNIQLAITGQIINSNTANTNVSSNDKKVNIKTKNAVPNEKIQQHIEENIIYGRTMGVKEIMPCQIHNGVAYMVGGSPSYKLPEKLKVIRKSVREPNHYLFSSKTALPFLLENKIKPYACILLDPREHIPSFVTETEKDIIYFVASQCNPQTLKNLVNNGNTVFLYHAGVNAGEADVLKKLGTKSPLIGGGSTSVMRGMGLLQVMGFHQFKLFGVDSSYPEKPVKVHGFNQEKPSMQVTMNDNADKTDIGKQYWTDPELIAQCNDMEMIMRNWFNIKIENYSDGMMGDMFKHLSKSRRQYKDFMKGKN